MNIQINKDNANTQNINQQYNYYLTIGTAFVPVADCKEEKYYESIKDSLYYPAGYLDKTVSTIEAEHSILIQGQQGSGKSILSFKIAEQMKQRDLITSAYYLNHPSDWNTIKQWIQAIHFQERISHSQGTHLWIIDNLHKIADAIEVFPDSSMFGADYCIFCTRNLNNIPYENDEYFKMVLSPNQIFRLNIDEKIFLECYNSLAVNKIGRHESDYLYKCIGGNLAVLSYIITNGNLPSSLTDWQKEQFIDFHNIYFKYFEFGTAYKITHENLYDTLRMLFLSQIDFSIPFYLQCNVCQTVLKDFYFEIANKELEIEHASLAELLTVCICKEHKLDYSRVFTDCLHWVLSNLVNSRHDKQEQIRQINRFLQSLYSYKFVLNQSQALYEIRSYDECITDFLEKNICFISTSTWKIITEIVEKSSKINEVFCSAAISLQFIDAMCLNSDYDFQFFKDRLSQVKLEEVEKQILLHAMAIKESIVSSGNEVSLMHLLLSLSEEAAVEFIEKIPSRDLVYLLSGNNNGLFLFAHYYSMLGDDAKNILETKISTDNYKQIFINGASISGFACLLAAATDSLRKELCGLLTDDLIDRLVKNTIEKNYSINTMGMSLRQLKKESVDAFVAFEGALGVESYEELLQSQGTIPVLANLLEYSSEGMQKEMSRLLQSKPELVKSLVDRTIKEGSSIGTLDLALRELKRGSPDTLVAFEGAIGVGRYEELLQSQGTIPILARLLEHSSEGMRKKMSQLLQPESELVKSLVDRTIEEGSSIGTFNLALRELKRESPDVLAAFEGAIGVGRYEELLQSQGNIRILAHLLEHSSEEMRKEMSRLLQSKPKLVKILMERTINEGSSIGTLHLSLRELKRESADALEAFEDAIGVRGYERLLQARGTISILAHLLEYSSEGMRKKMSQLLQPESELVKSLVKRTIEEGSSIGTLDFSLRDLKKESSEAMVAFEGAIGIKGYEELLQSQGTIPILARLIRCSSAEMRKEMSRLLQSKPELVRSLVERTIEKGSSISSITLSLRDLKKESSEAMVAFEGAIGIKGYEELLQSQGTIPILTHLIRHSSAEMRKEMSRLLQSKPELVRSLVERTIEKGSSIGSISIPIKALSTKDYSCLQTLENLIGLDGYLAMFSNCNTNTITILRIMACSSLSDSLVDIIYANIDVWNESRNYISETSCTIMNDFYSDLYYARKMDRRKFFDFIMGSVSIDEWLDWIRRGATLEEAVLIIRYLPLDIAWQIANVWLQNYAEVINDILFVEQKRSSKKAIDSQIVNRAIRSIGNYNQQLSVLISKEYNMLLSSRDSEL